MTFKKLLNNLIEHQVILVGITRTKMPESATKPLKEEFIINPGGDYQLRKGDDILVIAFSELNIEMLLSEVPSSTINEVS